METFCHKKLIKTFLGEQASNFSFIFCDLWDTIPRQRSLISFLTFPVQPLSREAEYFPWCIKYFNHVPLLTWLIYFQPKGTTLYVLFMY